MELTHPVSAGCDVLVLKLEFLPRYQCKAAFEVSWKNLNPTTTGCVSSSATKPRVQWVWAHSKRNEDANISLVCQSSLHTDDLFIMCRRFLSTEWNKPRRIILCMLDLAIYHLIYFNIFNNQGSIPHTHNKHIIIFSPGNKLYLHIDDSSQVCVEHVLTAL